MKLAQVFCWMNLAGKVWKTVFSPKPQMYVFLYTSTISETPREIAMSPIQGRIMDKVACNIEDLFHGTRFHLKLGTYPV